MTARAVLAALAAATVACAPVAPHFGTSDGPLSDFRPQGVWRGRAQQVRTARVGSARPPALRGTLRLPVIPLAFPDSPPPFPAAVYQQLLFDPAPVTRPQTLSSYYAEVSHGLLRIEGEVAEWITMPHPARYYAEQVPGPTVYSVRLAELLQDALRLLDERGFDWAPFDNDGPDDRPSSGDDDGVVDAAIFVTAGVSLVCPGGRDFVGHKNNLSAVAGQAFETRTAWAGHRREVLKVDDYTIQSAVGGSTECDPNQPMGVGTVAHELGHGLGLPDLYGTDTAGIGQWGLMGTGGLATPLSPTRLDAWSLAELGWITVRTVTEDETIALPPIAIAHEAVRVPLSGSGEFLLIENRQATGTEAAHMDPSWRLASAAEMGPVGPGLLMWHVDEARMAANPGIFNRTLPHGLGLIQADDRSDLERVPRTYRTNWGDPGDPYPGSTGNRALGPTSVPPLLDHQGRRTAIAIDQISDPGPDGTITFRIAFER